MQGKDNLEYEPNKPSVVDLSNIKKYTPCRLRKSRTHNADVAYESEPIDWNGTRIYDLLVRKQTLKHLAKVA